MADLSDSIEDMQVYYNTIKNKKLDSVFGSRFIQNSKVDGYPIRKLILNRLANNIIRLFFLSNYNDFTNAFKIYRLNALKALFPFVSESFNIFRIAPKDYKQKL